MADFIPPCNPEAEEAVLGSLLIDPDAFMRVQPILKPEDFYREKNSWIYRTISDLHQWNEPSDFVTLLNELERRQELEAVGGSAYITSLVGRTPTAVHAEHYAAIVANLAKQRQLIAIGTAVAKLGYSDEHDVDVLVDRAQQMVMALSENDTRGTLRPTSAIVPESIDRLERIQEAKGSLLGVPTGFEQLDRLLGGFQPNDVSILAARPAVGKSALATNIAVHAAKRGYRVAFFSLEMSDQQLLFRMLSTESGVEHTKLTRGMMEAEEWKLVMEAADVLARLPLHIDSTSSLTPMQMRSKLRQLQYQSGLDMAIVDYVQLMSGGGRFESREKEVSFVSRNLKILSGDLKIPILLLSQMSRAIEQRAEHRPVLSDLRESGTLEQDASIVMFIDRPELRDENTDRKNIADVIVAKNRHGPTDTASLYFDPSRSMFADLELTRTPLESA